MLIWSIEWIISSVSEKNPSQLRAFILFSPMIPSDLEREKALLSIHSILFWGIFYATIALFAVDERCPIDRSVSGVNHAGTKVTSILNQNNTTTTWHEWRVEFVRKKPVRKRSSHTGSFFHSGRNIITIPYRYFLWK